MKAEMPMPGRFGDVSGFAHIVFGGEEAVPVWHSLTSYPGSQTPLQTPECELG